MIRQFLRPKSVKEALEMQRSKAKSVYLAGGTEIDRLDSSIQPSVVISLQDLKLDAITEDEHGIHIGSMVTFAKALESDLVPDFLKEALRFMGSATKRNMATIGGNVALSSDDSYLMPTLLAARCRLSTAAMQEDGSYGTENLPIREYDAYHEQYFRCLILDVVIPPRVRFVQSRRYARTVESHSALTCAFGSERNGQGIAEHVRMYAALKGSGIERFKETENLLEQGKVERESFHSILKTECVTKSDVTGSADYKSYLAEEAMWEMYGQFLKEER